MTILSLEPGYIPRFISVDGLSGKQVTQKYFVIFSGTCTSMKTSDLFYNSRYIEFCRNL